MNSHHMFHMARRGLGSRWAPSLGIGLIVVGLVTTGVAFAEPAAQTTPTCIVPPQGIVVTIGSPAPGAVLPVDGNVTVTGVAYDTSVTDGTGIDRVSVFLGNRDAGGTFWGDATLGQPSPELGADRSAAGYSRRSPTIPAGSGTREIFVYAHTSSGREASASIPVFLGAAPTAVRGQVPTAVPPPLPACTPTPAPSPTATPFRPSRPSRQRQRWPCCQRRPRQLLPRLYRRRLRQPRQPPPRRLRAAPAPARAPPRLQRPPRRPHQQRRPPLRVAARSRPRLDCCYWSLGRGCWVAVSPCVAVSAEERRRKQ